MSEQQRLIELFEGLSPDQQNEAIDFLEYLNQRKRKLKHQAVQEQPVRQFGFKKGLVLHMSDDFNEPLEDFVDYM